MSHPLSVKVSLVVSVVLFLFFSLTFFSVIEISTVAFRFIFVIGLLVSFISLWKSPNGKLRTSLIAVNVLMATFYLIGIKFMRLLFQGNGF